MLRVRVTLPRTRHRSARLRQHHTRDFNSPHIIHPLRRRFLPSHSTEAGAVLAEQVADTAAVEVLAAAQVVAREVVPAAGPEAVRVGRAAALAEPAEARAGRAVVRAPVGLALAVRIAILRTIKRGRSFRSFLRLQPRINR
jgi:hypothetical protein